MNARRIAPVLIAVGVGATATGCADIPRDAEHTQALVRQSKTIRLGTIVGTVPEPAASRALTKLERMTGAGIQHQAGDSERLLGELEDGKIDLVYGTFALDSPWATKVHMGHALGWRAEPPHHVAAPRFVYRNGENGWIMRVEQAANRP